MTEAERRDYLPVLGIRELLELHPWPAAYAAEKRLEWLWHFDLPGTPDELWPFIADTSRLNRALGGPRMIFEEREGRRWGSASHGGFRHEWIEVPWSWVAGQWLTCTRIYERGFSRVVFAVHRLEPIAIGTRLYLYFGSVPRGAVAAAALRLGFPSIGRACQRVLPAIAAELGATRPEVLAAPPAVLSEEADRRLVAQRAGLIQSSLPPASVEALVSWIRAGDEADLHRIQIRERARTWKLPEDDLLRVALHATRAGVLTLSWDTICPHCRGVRDQNPELGKLRATSRCDTCDLDFGTDTPEAVEVTFHVHPSIREIEERLYCSAEPAMKEHIRVQLPLAPGERTVVRPSLAPGRYRVRSGDRAVWYLDVAEDGPGGVLRWSDCEAGAVVLAAPAAEIELFNDGDAERTFVIERSTWSDHALRPGRLLSFQDFRDLFSEEYIGADVRLGVGEQTLLFTDVVGSTGFYASRGDPGAFVEIKRHFDEVFAVVRANRGAVVKTVGDAVMATFVDPLDAVRASKQIQDTFPPDRADSPIRLRISLNTGPCIAVRLNADADYFGGTVNIAAKLQALAEGHQIAMSEATYRSPGVAAYLTEQGAELEELTYTSKALPAPVGARRWTVHRGG